MNEALTKVNLQRVPWVHGLTCSIVISLVSECIVRITMHGNYNTSHIGSFACGEGKVKASETASLGVVVEIDVTFKDLKQLGKLSLEGPDDKCLRFCGLNGLCCNY